MRLAPLLGQRDAGRAAQLYGVLLITDVDSDRPAIRRTTMTHGTTLHGMQFKDPARRREATSYYGPGSGVDVALRSARRRADHPLRVGVVGMGAGTIASYAEAGDAVAYYEINPAVVDLGLSYFSFCSDASQRGAQVDITLGDARLTLQNQLDAGQPQASTCWSPTPSAATPSPCTCSRTSASRCTSSTSRRAASRPSTSATCS